MKRAALPLFAALALVLGCGPARPSSQLLDARVAYQKASVHPSASSVSPSLLEAKEALDRAERAREDGDVERAKNLAYLAHRKALAAEAKAETMRAIESKRLAVADFQHFQDMQDIARREKVDREKGELAKARREAEAARKAREVTESKIAELRGVEVERTERGLVLAVACRDLFLGQTRGPRESVLTPAGKERLRRIAETLKGDARTVLISAHTGEQGPHEAMRKRSEERAEAVRRFFESEGIARERLRTEGVVDPVGTGKPQRKGEGPRRIEIVLEDAPPKQP